MPDRDAGIAVQQWTVRDRYDVDPRGTLRRLAAIGYRAVELVYSRTGGLTHAEQRTALEDAGLRAPAMHCFHPELVDDLDGVLDGAAALGAAYVVCAWVAPEQRQDAAGYRRLARELAVAGERCRARGLRLCYHHHDFELAHVGDGRRGMELIWETVDPELLAAEVDVYWVHAAGLDVLGYLRELGDRCVLLHCKDHLPEGSAPLSEPGEGLARYSAEVGAGVLDFPAILAAAPHARWLVTEQDFSAGDPFESARVSLENLRRLLAAGTPA